MRTLRPLGADGPRLQGLGAGLRWWRLDVDGELLAFIQSGGDTTLPVRGAWAWSGKAWIQLY